MNGEERRNLLDAMCDFLDAGNALLAAVRESRDAYAAGFDAGVLSQMEVEVEVE